MGAVVIAVRFAALAASAAAGAGAVAGAGAAAAGRVSRSTLCGTRCGLLWCSGACVLGNCECLRIGLSAGMH